MTEITPEQKKKLDKIALNFLFKGVWNGVHHALMAAVMTFLLFLLVSIYFNESGTVMMIGSFSIGFFIIRRMLRVQQDHFIRLKEDAEKIIKN
jgi:hypothetical protein